MTVERSVSILGVSISTEPVRVGFADKIVDEGQVHPRIMTVGLKRVRMFQVASADEVNVFTTVDAPEEHLPVFKSTLHEEDINEAELKKSVLKGLIKITYHWKPSST
jgi:hypothetical protein